jgi:hypothetical protein
MTAIDTMLTKYDLLTLLQQSTTEGTRLEPNSNAIATDLAAENVRIAAVVAAAVTVAADVAVLVADGATPTQAHVTTLNTGWGTLNTAIGTL